MADDLGNFLGNLQASLMHTAQTSEVAATKRDNSFEYFCTPAPNAIEWAVTPEFADVESVYHHVRQYQVIRDFFQLRCPLSSCNNQSPEYKDCWGKGREYLQSENLLIWSPSYNEDACPCCKTTRSEFVQDRLLNLYSQLHGVAGMRCLPHCVKVLTSNGLLPLGSLLPSNPIPDTFYPISNIKVLGESGWEDATEVYYAGKAPTKHIQLEYGLTIDGSHIHPVYGYSNGQ